MKTVPTTDPRLLIVGAGALGGLFAARLGRRWSGVHLLDRREDRAAHIQDRGLHITGVSLADWSPGAGRVRASAQGWPLMDAAFFFIKAPHFPAALKAAAPVIGPRTALVIFPETVDVALLKARSRQAVLALTDDRARPEGLGRIVHEAQGETRLDGNAPAARALLLFFQQAGIPVSLDKKVPEKRWITHLAQVCIDAPAALADAPQRSVLAPPLDGFQEKLLGECLAVAKALRRPLSMAALKERRDALIAKAPDAKSPLGRDLLRGRPTERAALLDPLLAAARAKKIKVPTLDAFDRLLRRLEKEGPAA